MKREIESYRGRLASEDAAARYAHRFAAGSRRRTHLREQAAVARIFSGWTQGGRVLDTPCGAGRFLDVLSRHATELTLMDTSEAALELARTHARELNVQATFLVGDASNTGLPDASVDVVFCNRLLHHLTQASERARFLREFSRVTARHLVLSFFDYLRFGPLRAWLKRLKGRRVDYAGQPTQAQFTAELAACGFRLQRVVPIGPPWVAQKYLVLEKTGGAPAPVRTA
jgi:ubiquinone/menaquinone biosynthesis C-methylase UbiE